MKIVFFTYEINQNSKVLSFAIDWINEIAKYVDKVYVVSFRCGEAKLRDNVELFCINQDKKNRLQTIFSIWSILYYIHKKDKNIDGYFVHMAHYFVPFIYPFSLFYKQKIVMWKAHKATPLSLKIADKMVDRVLTSTKLGYRIKSNKAKVIGQGIDTEKFYFKNSFNQDIKKFAVVGRISPTKNTLFIVEQFIEVLKEKNDLRLYIVGDITDDKDTKYLENIKKIVSSYKDNIILVGQIPRDELPKFYENMDMCINIGDTGSLDKVIVEPMAMGIPVITSNDSAKSIFKHLENKGVFFTDKQNLKNVILKVLNKKIEYKLLREEIVKKHSLKNLVRNIINEFS